MLNFIISFALLVPALAGAETRILVKSDLALKDSRPLYGLSGWRSIRVSDRDASRVIRHLAGTPGVEWVERDQRYTLDRSTDQSADQSAADGLQGPNDPRVSEQWALSKMGATEALSLIPVNAKEVLVAVVDSGVDLNHPDLKSQIFTNDASDDFNHGTHVAGIIGATQNNGIGGAGVSPKVRVLPVRWLKNGSGWGEDAIAAIHDAVKAGARIINASWGGIGYSKALEEAVREAEKAGVLFVASAGNQHSDNDVKPHHPANLRFSNVISVASVDQNDELEPYSNFGLKQVELAAPGKAILSTMMNGQYGLLSGTSMAAAEVSGVAALLLLINPSLTAQDLKRILISTVKPVEGLAKKTITGGRIDALRAAQATVAQTAVAEIQNGSRLGSATVDDSDLSSETPFKRDRNSGNLLKPDSTESGSPVEGLEVHFVRIVKGKETPVAGIEFRAQIHLDGTDQKMKSDDSGQVRDRVCKKDSISVMATLESARYRVTPGTAPYEILLSMKCGTVQKVIFNEDSEAGQAIGIWQGVTQAEKRLNAEVGLGFWKRQITMLWPGAGDYYSGDQVNLTQGHHWDVVSHELGHAIYDQGGIGTFGGGQHYIDQCYSEALALSEGWASFFAAWLNIDLSDPDAKFEFMVPRRAPIRFETIPGDVCQKATNEWRVIGFFWDLIDQHNDGETLSVSFQRLWRDLQGARVPSAAKARERLLVRGWDQARMNLIWNLNFPGDEVH